MKYGIWKVSQLEAGAVNALVGSGYAPLAAMVLASRGIGDDRQARAYLDCNAPLLDPFLMTDMDKAAGRVGLAMSRGEKIAVFGDYDVDGITATCLLTDFLRRHGADVVSYIPGRLEEGYGLNPIAIHQLHAEGVKLIVTVDCGITAVSEAELCKQLGIDLVITDHHECKQTLPAAIAVVDPHRCDGGYPHKNLSGVGVAFKLASALCGSQETVLEEYADMVCLGTVADVMPLQGENRVFVARGLESLAHTKRPGIAALMAECGCAPETVSASSIGFMLAPRINAAGRMGQIDLAVELFLTDDPDKAAEAARGLCELNRQRQAAKRYIRDIVKAVLWFANTFQGGSWDLGADVSVEFDDSYITDKDAEMEQMRSDAVSFSDIPIFRIRYVMARLNCDEEQARQYIAEGQQDPDLGDETDD